MFIALGMSLGILALGKLGFPIEALAKTALSS